MKPALRLALASVAFTVALVFCGAGLIARLRATWHEVTEGWRDQAKSGVTQADNEVAHVAETSGADGGRRCAPNPAGLCPPPEVVGIRERRRSTFEAFEAVQGGSLLHAVARADPHVAQHERDHVMSVVQEANVQASQFLEARAPLPSIFIYRDKEQMNDLSCAKNEEIAYYDGELHVVADMVVAMASKQRFLEAVVHALSHHLLATRGVCAPAWLYEGLAMFAAQEVWWVPERLGLRAWGAQHHLPFSHMVTAQPHVSDPKLSVAEYYQSLTMVQAINHNCGSKRLQELLEALRSGSIDPNDAFQWALRGGADAEEAAWANAVRNQCVMGGFYREWREGKREGDASQGTFSIRRP